MTFDEQPILVIEDNEDDAFIFGRAFKRAQLRNPLYFVVNGQQAIDYLSGRGEFSDRVTFPLPFLILLDLKLPLRNGLDVLQWLREQAELAATLVVVLTSSAEQRDLQRARDLGAAAYLVKPPTSDTLANLFATVRETPAQPATADAFRRLRFAGDLFGDS